ncbi:MAG TPA: sugar ABC transporter ATP-binding protein [Nocardia sp.]|uniref:sugar ABC transporter ATP-binding protein n=1 Tax=Nocardia TaxID=1817 RepID=UPI0024588CC7|nr:MULTISPECIES: sugar ABC transporter ATP-binding protein [Nocardia]HLS77554.1 sugar ABC transporter ATP-binding protein [Nocardia sp.]
MSAPRAALEVRALRKSYGGALALDGVDLTVRAGEVHALLGQNGCGKSTLVKSLTGIVTPDDGRVEVFGRPLPMPVDDPHTHGIAVIHQDIGLVEDMTVLENLGANARYGTRLLAPVRTGREKAIYRELMARLDFDFPLDAKVATLSPAERALLAVVRAMRLMDGDAEGHLFILDEPTAALPRPEAARLLTLMRKVADAGSGVIFISHRLAEVMQVCDRATVMRAGRRVAEVDIAETTRAELVAHMLGRRMDDFYPAPPDREPGRARLVVRGLTGSRVADVDFTAHAGEIVGVTGLAGMGQEEVPMLLAGAQRPTSGTVRLDGAELPAGRPAEAIGAGMVLVPGNRLRDGCWPAGTAEENVVLPVVKRYRRWKGLEHKGIRERARTLMTKVNVHPNRPDLPMTAFSGGNQQKIVFAKWLQLDPKVLLLDEPTQGVDPGSAKELLADATTAAAEGSAVVVFSGEHEMLAAVCHRVLVLQHGRLVAELRGDELTEAALLEACESAPAEHPVVAA